MTNYMIMFGDTVEIVNVTKLERHSVMGVLKGKNVHHDIMLGMLHQFRTNNISSIYIIESEGDETILRTYYEENNSEFIETVQQVGRCIYAK